MRPPVSRRTLLAGLAIGEASGAAAAAGAAPAGLSAMELRILRIYRELTPPQQDAWLRMAHRIGAGMSPRLAGYRMHRELGATAREARDRVNEVLADVAAGRFGDAWLG